MTDSQTDTSLKRLLSEHGDIFRQIAGLRRFWHEVNELGHGPKYGEMASRVAELRDLLSNHFADEERGGYLADALQRAPGFTERAEQLRRQHQQMLDTLDEYIAKLKACETSYHSWHDVLAEFDDFLQLLNEHESAETAIVEVALEQ